MSTLTAPLDTLVPIRRFGRGTAIRGLTKAFDGASMTVLHNGGSTYLIVGPPDYWEMRESEVVGATQARMKVA